jgi:hypothetical protein
MFIEPEPVLDIFSCYVQLGGFVALCWATTLRKHLHFSGHKGPVKKAYMHRAFEGWNSVYIIILPLSLQNFSALLSNLHGILTSFKTSDTRDIFFVPGGFRTQDRPAGSEPLLYFFI